MEALEANVFAKASYKESALIEYGFILQGSSYHYETDLSVPGFKAYIDINQNGEVKGKVIETDLGEEYSLFRSFNATGFAFRVGAAYKAVLEDIRDHCFRISDYRYPQTMRIMNAIEERYGILPETIFEDKTIKVMRHPDNLKWFGLLMGVSGKKIGRRNEAIVEILNVKINPDELYQLTGIKGVYLAYHMSKKHWVTFSLDDSLPDKMLLEYIDASFNLTKAKKKKGA